MSTKFSFVKLRRCYILLFWVKKLFEKYQWSLKKRQIDVIQSFDAVIFAESLVLKDQSFIHNSTNNKQYNIFEAFDGRLASVLLNHSVN